MKFFFLFLGLFLSLPLFTQYSLEIRITNVAHDNGVIFARLFNDKKEYPKANFALQTKATEARKGTVSLFFQNLEKGTYAITAFHDENNNGILDRVLVFPEEGTAFSNNAFPTFGPPNFKKATITLKRDTVCFLKMKY